MQSSYGTKNLVCILQTQAVKQNYSLDQVSSFQISHTFLIHEYGHIRVFIRSCTRLFIATDQSPTVDLSTITANTLYKNT
jgi:hypothetical protein